MIYRGKRLNATAFYSAPEFSRTCLIKSSGWSGEALMVYTLGKNLYESMLYNWDVLLKDYHLRKKDRYEFDDSYFHHGIFAYTDEGPALKALIQDMVRIDPEQRISLETVISRMVKIRCSLTVHMHQHCLEQLKVLKTYQFVYNPGLRSFITETERLLNTRHFLDLSSINARIQGKLAPLLLDVKINEHKALLQYCHEQYEQLVAMDDHWLDADFYAEKEAKFASLDEGEIDDYPAGLIGIEESLREGRACVMSRMWRQRQHATHMLHQILMHRCGEKDQAILQYVCDKDRLLSLSIKNAQAVKQLHQEIQQTLESLEAPELQQIKHTIAKLRTKRVALGWCGIAYFFSHKRKIFPTEADEADILEESLAKLPLVERNNAHHHLEIMGVKVKKSVRTATVLQKCAGF